MQTVFARAIEERVAVAGRHRLAVFDIDRFKQVNDRYGHAAGDEVLKTFARMARKVVREDDRIARLGGEEFAVLLSETTLDQAMTICERLRKSIENETTYFEGHEIRVSVSGGIALLVQSDGLAYAMAAADTALYEAKRAGRNRLALAA